MERVQRELDERADQLEMQARINTAENLPLGPTEWQHDHAGKDLVQLCYTPSCESSCSDIMPQTCAKRHMQCTCIPTNMALTCLDRTLANLHAIALLIILSVRLSSCCSGAYGSYGTGEILDASISFPFLSFPVLSFPCLALPCLAFSDLFFSF